jgi:hypothetical protein
MDDMLMWKMFTGVLIFAAGNVLYFEIRRMIHFLQIYFKESQSLEDHLHSSDSGTVAAHVPK